MAHRTPPWVLCFVAKDLVSIPVSCARSLWGIRGFGRARRYDEQRAVGPGWRPRRVFSCLNALTLACGPDKVTRPPERPSGLPAPEGDFPALAVRPEQSFGTPGTNSGFSRCVPGRSLKTK